MVVSGYQQEEEKEDLDDLVVDDIGFWVWLR